MLSSYPEPAQDDSTRSDTRHPTLPATVKGRGEREGPPRRFQSPGASRGAPDPEAAERGGRAPGSRVRVGLAAGQGQGAARGRIQRGREGEAGLQGSLVLMKNPCPRKQAL